ncbi:MAG: hypothetical protein SFZ23_11515 [Planctomycetota bacterium]|nr:hypothetical protein [Planctomycetota bacterium]
MASLVLTGCSTALAPAGSGAIGRHITASYRVRSLSAELPPHVKPIAFIAAMESVVLNRGYAMTRADHNADESRLWAKPPNPDDFERVSVLAALSPSGTRIEIIVEPFGGEVLARSLLDGALVRLGL